MALTNAFHEAVSTGNVRRVRIMMKDSLLVDPSFREFNEMERAAATMHKLYDVHDGRALDENKEHWNTIILDGTIPDEDIRRMIAESYDLVTDSPSKRIYEAVKKIPKGRVATYGQIAELAGDKKMARAVGNALHKNPDPGSIPCYRVVNAKGELAGEFAFGGAGAQARLLEAEGVEVRDGKVDLRKYGMNA